MNCRDSPVNIQEKKNLGEISPQHFAALKFRETLNALLGKETMD